MTQNMNTGRFIRILFMLMVLFMGAANKAWAVVGNSDIIINATNGSIVASVGALDDPTTGCYRVTLTATPNTGYGITAANIDVEPLVDPASVRRRSPGIANKLTVYGSGSEFYFDLPERYNGALVTATFTPRALTPITKLSEITDQFGCYKIDGSFTWDSRTNNIGTSITPFRGVLDGDFVEFSLNSDPLFENVHDAIIKNVIISSAGISTNTHAGAIANVAMGNSRIYNCGVNSGSVSGSNYVGGIVGFLDGSARVINCYSYANVTSGSDRGGIVGYNNVASTSSDLRTMVMNCMFYGDITTGGTISPVYGGENISNASGGLNTFNYFRYDSPYSSGDHIDKYNSAIAVKEDYLVRFELYRNLLNSNKKLAAIYATGSADNADQMAKWVLETADRTVTSPMPYPILKKREYNKKYPSIINYDAKNAPTTGNRNQGKNLGTLDVTINESNTTSGGVTKPTGATVTTKTLTLNRTDKDYGHYNFNYDKVQLPYYNDVGTMNYTKNKVVTGWKITSITPSTGDGNAVKGTFKEEDAWGGYNFADRMTYAKDLYSKTDGGSERVFAQGAYFDVPYGVTAITIEPYWGNAAYIADENYDVIYTDDGNAATVYGSEDVTALGTQLTNSTKVINGDEQSVYTDLATAIGTFSGSKVYDNALVLIGNRHLKDVPSSVNTAYTMMSIDLDHDNEPDYSLIYHHDNRVAISPIRFDFLNVIGTAMAQKPQKPTAANASPKLYNVAIFKPKGWFEITNTCLIHFVQFEYDNGGKSSAPLILLGGAYDQFTSNHVATGSNWSSKTQYIHVGSNVYFKNFSNGCHGEVDQFTKHIPISATGGDYDGFYLSGIYRPGAPVQEDDGECYISGGRFNEVAGAAQQQIKGVVQWQIYDADITEFYGGGLNAAKPITGNITTNIYNSHVTTFCGGPKFGDMAGVDTPDDSDDDKTVTTNAEGCTFTNFFGAGYGGTSYNTVSTKDGTAGLTANFGSWETDYTGIRGVYSSENSGIPTDFEYDSFVWSTGRPAGRFYVKYASFSKAETNDVNSILKNCIITENFYGGGNRGKVNGKATSSLEDCNVTGDVFGAGYSVADATVDVRDDGFGSKIPRINLDTGLFEEGTLSGTTTYTWTHGSVSNGNSALGTNNEGQNVIYTIEDLTTLGQVSEVNLTIKGNTTIGGSVFGGGAESATNGDVTVKIIDNGTVTGNVYGGGDQGTVGGNTTVTLKDNVEVNGNVFGGGNEAPVSGSATVNIED